MLNPSNKTNSRSSFYRLIAATLTMGGVSLLLPLLTSAQVVPLTPAGTVIRNTATGTYEDPNNPGVPINTTSNQVTATVAEVAGVTNVPAGIVDVNGGSVTTADVVNYNFLITNVGNDVTAINIPGTATVVGGTQGAITVTEINGIVLTTPVTIPAGGIATNDALNVFRDAVRLTPALVTFDGTIPPNGTIRVQVPVTVTETVAGNPVSVRFGDVAPNNNSPLTQNVGQTGALPTDVYTINPATGNPGAPVNGVREAAAFTTVPLATAVNNVALATVLKTLVSSAPGATAALNDNLLTYRLDLRVEASPPAGTAGITPAPLLGTDIQLDASGTGVGVATTQVRVLVSDAIPALTTLDTTFVPAGIPAGWTRVYSTTVGGTALAATWRTGALPPTGVTRIGYINNGPLPTGTTTVGDANGFQFRVITSTVPAGGGTINNLAQVFGQSTAGLISPTNPLVYDESGDPNPNNFDPLTVSFPAPITNPATVPDGVANLANGTDANNNNTGSGPGGEINSITINPTGIILNGPPGAPGAIGPDGTAQTDFVNKSATDVPANAAPGTTYLAAGADPAPVTFTNTVQNPATNTNQLDNVTLEPISAALAASATGSPIALFDLNTTPNHAVLPNSTVVSISFGGRTAVYTLTAGEFVLTSSGTTASGGTSDAPAARSPIIIPSLAVGNSQNYTVTVDLPANAVVTTGYSVPIVSYVNSNTGDGSTFKRTANGTGATTLTQDNPFNIKIDRVYTGYLNLVKASQILQGTGPAVSPANATLDGNPKTPAPGNIILYQITYSNISTPLSGSGNVVLNANNIVITEDGAAGTNNWATTTFNVASTAADATAGAVITYFNGVTATTTTDVNVTRYLDSIPTLAPGAPSGVFTFQRVVK